MLDSIIKITAHRFKPGLYNFEYDLEDFIPGEEDVYWEDISDEVVWPEERGGELGCIERGDTCLQREIYGYRFECLGPFEMTGIQCEVEAVGWALVMGPFLKGLNKLTDGHFEKKWEKLKGRDFNEYLKYPKPAVDRVHYLTLWNYSAWQDYEGYWDSDYSLVRDFDINELT